MTWSFYLHFDARPLSEGYNLSFNTFSCLFPQDTPVEDGGEVEEAGEEDRPDSVASKTDRKEPKVTNQFNFSERASQTLNNPLRVGRSREEHLMPYLKTHIKYNS